MRLLIFGPQGAGKGTHELSSPTKHRRQWFPEHRTQQRTVHEHTTSHQWII